MNISQLRAELKKILPVPFTCVYNYAEKQYFIRVFDSVGNKYSYRNKIYDLEDKLFPDQGALFRIFVYDIEETKQYFPQYYDCSSQWKNFSTFSFQKSVQAINFFIRKLKPSFCLDELSILKAIFFADRYHLLKYGSTVTGDVYYAMKHGPVASACKDICKESSHLSQEQLKYAGEFLQFSPPHNVCSKKECEESVFTSSEKEALDVSLQICLSMPLKNLPEFTHTFFNWDKDYLASLPKNRNKRKSISPIEFFSLAKKDYCSAIPKEVLESNLMKVKICSQRPWISEKQ